MKITEMRQQLEAKIAKAIEDTAFFEESLWMDGQAIIGDETIALAASAAASVIVAVAEAQDYAIKEGHVKAA